MEKKVQNLLSFSDFERSWNPKEPKKTKRTETGLDVVEKKKLDDDDIDMEDIDLEDDIIDDELDGEEIEGVEDEMEDEGWEEQLSSLIDEIIEGGEEPEEILDFVQSYIQEEGGEDEIDIEDDEFDEEDLEDEGDEEDLDEEEIVADDEEGEEVQEAFRHWRKK